MTIEIITSRAISAQLIRHRSFTFQEFSQRYSPAIGEFEVVEARAQDQANRQNSLDTLDKYTKDWFRAAQETLFNDASRLYEEALTKGIAKECARNLLPLATQTKLYMTGNVRSWIHYLEARCNPATQKEHREIALAIRDILVSTYPTIGALVLEKIV
jgi:thymidylate synthase (FAD)